MAYDRYDTRHEGGYSDRDRGRRDERGFFERAGDEVASWFGGNDHEDRERMHRDDDRYAYRGQGRDFDRDRTRASRPMNWTSSDSDYRSSRPRTSRDYERMGYAGRDHDYSSRGGIGGTTNPDYMSPTGPSFGYGGTFGAGSSSGYGSGGWGSEYEPRDRGDYDRSESEWGRDDYRNTSYAGSIRDNDRHYNAWRERQMNELDRDYEQYCRERQEHFESDFGGWREKRMNKRQQLCRIREHMDVVGSDGESIGKVDCVKGDHIVLTKSDSPDNRHHSLDCSMIETVEGDQVRLEVPAEEAKSRWEDSDKRGFFGREDHRGHDTNLERSFSGTYESYGKAPTGASAKNDRPGGASCRAFRIETAAPIASLRGEMTWPRPGT